MPKIDGLDCWACRDDDGSGGFFVVDEHEIYKDKNGNWQHPVQLSVAGMFLADSLFPCADINFGECKRVVIPMVVIVDDT